MAIRMQDVAGGVVVSGYLPSPDPATRFDDRLLVSNEDTTSQGVWSSWALGQLPACDVATTNIASIKLLSPSPRPGRYIVGTLVSGEARYISPSTDVTLRPASLVVYRAWDAFSFTLSKAFRFALVAVTPEDLQVSESSLQRLARQTVPDTSPFSAALAAILSTAGTAESNLSEQDRHDVGVIAKQMLRRTVALSDGKYYGGVGDPRLIEIMDWIEQRVADPSLGAEQIAATHHISLRQLHRLFESTEFTCNQFISRKRLERIHEDIQLLDPRVSLNAIARRWGITDPSRLSRSFRQQFGYSPREARLKSGNSVATQSVHFSG